MKLINLLPASIRDQEVKQRMVPFVVLAVLGAIGAVVVPWLTLREVGADLQHQVTLKEASLFQSVAATDKSLQVEKERTDLILRTKTLNKLAAQEISWARVFDLVQSAVPQDVVLSSYNVSVAGTGLTLRMGGEAPSNLSFASFVESLKARKDFTQIVVDGFTFNPKEGTVTFSVTITVKPELVRFQSL